MGSFIRTFKLLFLPLLLLSATRAHSNEKINTTNALHYYSNQSHVAYTLFNRERKNGFTSEVDTVFLKIEKEFAFQVIKKSDLLYYNFNVLTQSVIHYVQALRAQDQLSLQGRKNTKLRRELQFNFIGLSHAIQKSNEINLQINADQYKKLHDILVSQATGLFYASYRENQKSDFFWTSYFLHQLNYPMDLVYLHLQYSKQWPIYTSQLANLALNNAIEINNVTGPQVDFLYSKARLKLQTDREIRGLQKNYLKQLNRLGDSEKVKSIKREMATHLLYFETQNLMNNPFFILDYLQFIIGYVFVAWPLEFIVILVSLLVLAFQSGAVLTIEEKQQAKKNPAKKIWLMFVKSYMGSQVPFFSKLAASLILFGIGLYFNSARNFVESLVANM